MILHTGNCPCGWVEYGDQCYYISHTDRETYALAQDHCEAYDSNLASILSQEEQEFIAGWYFCVVGSFILVEKM